MERGGQPGNKNGAKKQRLLTDALKRHLIQNPEDAERVMLKLVASAIQGEPWAQQLIHDRVDGKVPQAIVGDSDEDPVQIQEIGIRAVDSGPPKEG